MKLSTTTKTYYPRKDRREGSMKNQHNALIPVKFPPGHVQKHVIPALVVDALIVIASFIIAYVLRDSQTLNVNSGAAIVFVVFSLAIWLTTLFMNRVYHRVWAYTSGLTVAILGRSAIVATVITMIVAFLAQRPLPISIVFMANVLTLVGIIVARYRGRVFRGILWRWRAVTLQDNLSESAHERVLIVGGGLSGQDLAQDLERAKDLHKMIVVGYVDDDEKKQGLYLEDRPVLGTTEDIAEIVEDYRVDVLAVAIHNIVGKDFRRILEACEKTNARIKVVPDVVKTMKQTQTTELLRQVRPDDLIGRSVISTHEAVDLSPVQNRVVLVTGAAGSIGSELSRQLPGQTPTKLILLDVNESGLHDLAMDLQARHEELDIIQALVDIRDKSELEAIFKTYQPQVVFHAAAYKHVPMLERHPNAAVQVNIHGTRNLATLSRDYNVERFVMVSTDKAVNPSSVMGASKRVCEMIVRELASQDNDTLWAIVRFGNVLGSRGSVVPTFTRQIDKGGPITVTHPEMTRYFMSIPEAANLIIHAACLTQRGDTFLLRMGETVKIVELAERMIRLRGMRPYQDIDIQFSGVRPGEKMHEELFDNSEEDANETQHPGIIRLESRREVDTQEFMSWVDKLIENGIERENAISILRYGLDSEIPYALPSMNKNGNHEDS